MKNVSKFDVISYSINYIYITIFFNSNPHE